MWNIWGSLILVLQGTKGTISRKWKSQRGKISLISILKRKLWQSPSGPRSGSVLWILEWRIWTEISVNDSVDFSSDMWLCKEVTSPSDLRASSLRMVVHSWCLHWKNIMNYLIKKKMHNSLKDVTFWSKYCLKIFVLCICLFGMPR